MKVLPKVDLPFAHRFSKSRALGKGKGSFDFAILQDRVEDSFDVIMSGDESWFVYLYKFDHIFATG
jgi:hypothetical protein